MKIHSFHLQFGIQLGLCLAASLPLPSHAGVEVPYWLYPEWIAAKVVDFHARNTERLELAQLQALQAQQAQTKNSVNSTYSNTVSSNDQNQRKQNLAPVETANAKVNEKLLTKDELLELRKQLRLK